MRKMGEFEEGKRVEVKVYESVIDWDCATHTSFRLDPIHWKSNPRQ